MIRIQESVDIGYLGPVIKGLARASVGSNATIAPILGSLHILKRDLSRDVKTVKPSLSHVACGSTPATMTKILETRTRMTVLMIERDARHVERVNV
jgi:hypothetical protein